MSILIDENLIGLWYAMTGEKDDFMLAISRTPEGLELVYRHRYYYSDDPWDERDEKSWYRMVTTDADEQKAIGIAREMVTGVVRISVLTGRLTTLPPKFYELLKGDKTVEQLFEAFKALPFVHTKTQQ